MRLPRSSKMRPSRRASELVRERRLPRRCSSSLACTVSNSARSIIGSCSPGWLWRAEVDPVAQKMGERAVAEGHAADDFARGAGEQGRRNCDAKCLGCSQIDHELEFSWLFDRQIGWLRAFAGGKPDLQLEKAAELVRLKVDLISQRLRHPHFQPTPRRH